MCRIKNPYTSWLVQRFFWVFQAKTDLYNFSKPLENIFDYYLSLITSLEIQNLRINDTLSWSLEDFLYVTKTTVVKKHIKANEPRCNFTLLDGAKTQTRKIHKYFELYHVFMYNFFCQTFLIFQICILFIKIIDAFWSGGISSMCVVAH